jgi:hypothetical protein
MQNKFFKIVAIGAALVFTAGAAAGAFGLTTGSGLLGSLSSSSLTSGVFAAGQSFGTAAAGAFGAAGTVGASATGVAAPGVAAPGVTAAGTAAAPASSGLGAVASGASPGVGAAVAPASSLGAAGEAAAAGLKGYSLEAGLAPSGNGLLTAAAKLGSYVSNNPGAALMAGNIIQGATAPDQTAEERRALRRMRKLDNRYGVNNVTGQVGLDTRLDGAAFEQAGQAYTGGLLERVQAQRAQQASRSPGVAAPGAYSPAYSAPPPVVDPAGTPIAQDVVGNLG